MIKTGKMINVMTVIVIVGITIIVIIILIMFFLIMIIALPVFICAILLLHMTTCSHNSIPSLPWLLQLLHHYIRYYFPCNCFYNHSISIVIVLFSVNIDTITLKVKLIQLSGQDFDINSFIS